VNKNSKFDITALIENYDVLSFDVFDTTLFRKAGKPKNVFLLRGKLFYFQRVYAEKLTRIVLKSFGKDEVSINQIYVLLPFYKIEDELTLEKKQLFADPDMLEIFKICQSKKKRIYFVSDMYLGANVISDFLLTKGVKQPFKVISSSDHGKPKSKGLFEILLDRERGVNPERVLHIGDNFRSDFLAAKNYGMASYLIESEKL
jgi:HAD superfamily hydrolase (TIGR01549 family)